MFQPETDPNQPFRDAFVAAVDAAIQKKRAEQPRRQYLGASTWGEPCARKLAYSYHQHPQDEDRGFTGNNLRIFDMGHDGEDRVAEYLRLAGFDLKTHGEDGKQFGFAAADGRLKGHFDGLILGGPSLPGLTYPCLWENKMLNDKGWNDTLKNGVKKAKPLYYAQAQTYMAYKGLACALFTACNRDTGALLGEVIAFNQRDAQTYSDRAVSVIESKSPDDFPRLGKNETDFVCKWCDYKRSCWKLGAPIPAQPKDATPSWLA